MINMFYDKLISNGKHRQCTTIDNVEAVKGIDRCKV